MLIKLINITQQNWPKSTYTILSDVPRRVAEGQVILHSQDVASIERDVRVRGRFLAREHLFQRQIETIIVCSCTVW